MFRLWSYIRGTPPAPPPPPVEEAELSDSDDTINVLAHGTLLPSLPEPVTEDDGDYGTQLQPSRYTKFPTSISIDTVDTAAESDINFNLDFLERPRPRSEYDAAVSNFYFPANPVNKYKYSIIDTIVDVTLSLTVTDFVRLEREKLLQKITSERKHATSRVVDLTPTQLNEVDKYWRLRAQGTVVSSAYNIDITIRDLHTLCYGKWLNDNVIDFYLNLISELNPLCYGWTTHFFTTLQERGYLGVARWAKRRKVNVTEKTLVLVPINIMHTHWALAVVDNEYKTITYYDSLSSRGNLDAVKLIQHYMMEEAKKTGSPLNYAEFELIPNFATPQQQNGFDCGVFTCSCAKWVADSKPLTYLQNDMKVLRRRMAWEIANKQLLP